MIWGWRKKAEVDEVESARGNMVWCAGGMMMMSWGKMILDLKGYCLHSKNIGCPSKEFKSRKMKWSDVSFEKISLASVWRTNWKRRPHLPFSIWRNTLVFGFATVASSPSVHFFFYYCGLFWRCLSLSTLYKMYDPNYPLQENALCFCDDMASNLSILTHVFLTVVVSKHCAPYHGRNKIKQTFLLLLFEQL